MAAVLNLSDVTSGDDRSWSLTFTTTGDGLPIDITLWTLTADIRAVEGASSTLGSFVVAVTDGPNGVASLTLPKAVTSILPATTVYDLQAINGSGDTRTYFKGTITTERGVTK